MKARIRRADENSDVLLIANSCRCTAMALCLALRRQFGFADVRLQRFVDALKAEWDKYYSMSTGTRYVSRVHEMFRNIRKDAYNEIGYNYMERDKVRDDMQTQDFLFIAAVSILHRDFGLSVHGATKNSTSKAVTTLLNEYNSISGRLNNINRQIRLDITMSVTTGKDSRIDMLEWMERLMISDGISQKLIESLYQWTGELKDCVQCGKKAEIRHEKRGGYWLVRCACPNCGLYAETPDDKFQYRVDAEELCVKAWNNLEKKERTAERSKRTTNDNAFSTFDTDEFFDLAIKRTFREEKN